MRVMYNKLFHLFVIVFLTLISFSNTFQNNLVWDDHLFIEQWQDIKSATHIQSLLTGSAPEGQGKLFRPIRSILYLIDYSLWQTNPFFYHLQAFFIHLFSTILVYFIVLEILKCLKQSSNGTIKQSLIPFIASLLFGLHPIHTETISYIASSMETLGTVFFFVSFFLYLKSSNQTIFREARSRFAREQFSNPYFIISLLFAFLAFFTYEMTLTLPILMLLYELCFGRQILTTIPHRKNQNLKLLNFIENCKLKIVNYLYRLWPYFMLAFIYLYIRVFMLGIIARNDYLGYSFYATMLIMVKVIVRYIGLLFLPINLTANHLLVGDFPVSMLPYDKLDPILSQSIFDLDVLISLSILITLIITAFLILKRLPLVTFCIGWFFISLLPVSNIIPHGATMAEKFLYIPSFGFILLIVFILDRLFNLINSRTTSKISSLIIMIIIIPLVIVYSYLTYQRNKDWKDDISLFNSMLRSSPNSLIANYTLGIHYAEKNQYQKAIQHYTNAIKKAPGFWEAQYNLGNVYVKLGKNKEAIDSYKKVMEKKPDFQPAQEQFAKLIGNITLIPDTNNPGKLQTPSLTNLLMPQTQSLLQNALKDFAVSFSYPKGFTKQDNNGIVTLINTDKSFTILITPDTKNSVSSLDQYIQSRTDTYGTLINQGLAKIPNIDIAYVKIWSDNSISKHQFFLFKQNKVVEVLVYPSDSTLMKDFDTILGSISF